MFDTIKSALSPMNLLKFAIGIIAVAAIFELLNLQGVAYTPIAFFKSKFGAGKA